MSRTKNARVVLLALVAIVLVVAILSLSFRLLPPPPLSPTPTFPEGIEYPNARPRPYR